MSLGEPEEPLNSESTAEVVWVEHLTDAPVVGTVTLRCGLALGLNPHRASEAARLASELATHMVQYEGRGEIALEHVVDQGLWIVARDHAAKPSTPEEPGSEAMSRGRPRESDHPERITPGSGAAAMRQFSDEAHLGQRQGGGSEVRCLIRLGL
jgi:anti-sigma regulatory factor (Ser/Thr protein kinase)